MLDAMLGALAGVQVGMVSLISPEWYQQKNGLMNRTFCFIRHYL